MIHSKSDSPVSNLPYLCMSITYEAVPSIKLKGPPIHVTAHMSNRDPENSLIQAALRRKSCGFE